MSTLNMQQDDHPAHNLPNPTEQYAGMELPNPFGEVGSYNADSAKTKPTEVGPRKIKGSDKGRPPLRPGD